MLYIEKLKKCLRTKDVKKIDFSPTIVNVIIKIGFHHLPSVLIDESVPGVRRRPIPLLATITTYTVEGAYSPERLGEGENPPSGAWSCRSPSSSISPSCPDLGHTCTDAWRVFQAGRARIRNMCSAMWDLASLTTGPWAGPAHDCFYLVQSCRSSSCFLRSQSCPLTFHFKMFPFCLLTRGILCHFIPWQRWASGSYSLLF